MDLFSISPLFVASFFHFSLEDSPNLQSEIRSSLESTRARDVLRLNLHFFASKRSSITMAFDPNRNIVEDLSITSCAGLEVPDFLDRRIVTTDERSTPEDLTKIRRR